MPVRTFQRRLSGSDDINQIQLSVRESVSTEKAQQDISRFMRERRRLADGDNDDFSIMDQKELASALGGTTRTLTALLAAIAAVSLLVGGIGIMNIVLATVLERTREIGVRRSVGARRLDIARQFVSEAVLISAGGGLLGIAFGFLLAWTIARTAEWTTIVTTMSVIMAFGVSVTVGVLFGVYPALKAARIDPIDALRYE
jgi:putative ABC transport system permease protein